MTNIIRKDFRRLIGWMNGDIKKNVPQSYIFWTVYSIALILSIILLKTYG